MTPRENLLKAMRRDNPKWVPFCFDLCPSQLEQMEKITGTKNVEKHYDFPFRFLWLKPSKSKTDYTRFFDKLPDGALPHRAHPEWGVYMVYGSVAHFVEILSPMAGFESIDEILAYPFPDMLEDYRWQGMADRASMIKMNGQATVAFMQMTIFETAWRLRGMENFLMDMIADTELAEALLDKITNIRIGMAEKYAKAGVDIVMLGDDVSTQLDMMMNPDVWRTLIKPRLKKVIDATKNINKDILVFYHGDGNLQSIIPDLIEIGIDILNPIQPECMNPIEIKNLYGDRLSFWGGLGTQTTMPFGSTDDVRKECRRLIDNLGKGGGFLLAPTHTIEPEVPWDNIMAFIDTAREYGRYK